MIRGGNVPRVAQAYLSPLPEDAEKDAARRSLVMTSDEANALEIGFQYYPETVTDNRGINYSSKEIPGLSHPLRQWSWGGDREISFTAVFTRDRVFSDEEKTNITQGNPPKDLRNIDIPSAVAWLRSYTYPEYPSRKERPKPPRRVILTLPGLKLGIGKDGMGEDDFPCVMTQCEVSYESFFSDGSPRIARVNLGFAETIQYGGKINPVNAVDIRRVAMAGYTIKPSLQKK